MKRDFSELEIAWASVGAAFNVPSGRLRRDVDPEMLVKEVLGALNENPRYAPMLAAWLENFGDLLDKDRLKAILLSDSDPSALVMLDILSKSRPLIDSSSLSSRLQKILGRALDERLAPLAASKIKFKSHVAKFNKFFSQRTNA